MEIHHNTTMKNLQHFTHRPVEHRKIITFLHLTTTRMTCIPAIIFQVMQIAFNLQTITIISLLHIQCKIIIIQIIMILNYRTVACIRTLVYQLVQTTFHIHHHHPLTAFHRHHQQALIIIINGILSNLLLS